MPIHKKRILEQLEKGVSLENIASWNNITPEKLRSILSVPDFRKGVPLKIAHALVETRRFVIGKPRGNVRRFRYYDTGRPHPAWEWSAAATKLAKKFRKKIVHIKKEVKKRRKNTDMYSIIHKINLKNQGKAKLCENIGCPKTSNIFQWATKHGRELSSNPENFYQLCVLCHRRYDLRKIEIRTIGHEYL